MKIVAILFPLLVWHPWSWSAEETIPCDVADVLAEKAYQRVYLAMWGGRSSLAVAHSQSFWDLENYAKACQKVIARAKDLESSGFDKNMRDTLSRAILANHNLHNAKGSSPEPASRGLSVGELERALYFKECGLVGGAGYAGGSQGGSTGIEVAGGSTGETLWFEGGSRGWVAPKLDFSIYGKLGNATEKQWFLSPSVNFSPELIDFRAVIETIGQEKSLKPGFDFTSSGYPGLSESVTKMPKITLDAAAAIKGNRVSSPYKVPH